MAFTKINAAGIGSTETVTLDGLTVINDGSFGGNVSVGGTLTYEDVTNIDSVGLITARAGVVVGSGITLSKDGDIFATGITTVSGNVKVGTGITLSPDGDGFFTGIVTATSYYGDGSNLSNITSTTINNNANDRLITGSGTANTLEGEANLTASAPSSGTGYVELKHGSSSGDYGFFQIRSGSTLRGRIGSNSQVDAIAIDTAGGSSTAMSFKTGSSQTERLRITSGGQVNIGNSLTQTSRLFTAENTLADGGEIAYIGNNDGGSNYGGLLISAGETDRECRLESAWGNSFMTFYTNDGSSAERVRIDASGRVLIGVTASYANASIDELQIGNNSSSNQSGLTIGSTDECAIAFADAGDARAGSITYNHSAESMIFKSNGQNERLRIKGDGTIFTNGLDGSVDISTTGTADTYDGMQIGKPPFRVTRTSHVTAYLNRTGSGGPIIQFRYGGSLVGSISNNSNSLPSDRNYKKDITNLTLGLDLVNKLQPVSYHYKFDADSDPVMYGLIAQDVETSLNDVGVSQNKAAILQYEEKNDEKDSDYSLDYIKFTPILINAVKELSAEIESLKSKIAALEG